MTQQPFIDPLRTIVVGVSSAAGPPRARRLQSGAVRMVVNFAADAAVAPAGAPTWSAARTG